MQYPQTRYLDSLDVGINASVLSLTVASVPPTRTQGILTLGRQQSNTEDVFYTSVAGNTVTISLRGLSQTALTLTSVAGNQKVHNANESVEMTTHHNYDTNKVRIDEAETISGVKTFTGVGNTFTSAPKTPGLLDANGNETIDTPATTSAVNELSVQNAATGNNVIVTTAGGDTNINLELQAKGTGKIIVEDGGEMKTNAAPTAQAGIVNKKYVDDAFTALSLVPLVKVAGENLTQGDAVYIKSSDGKVYKTDTTSFGEASENFIGFSTATVLAGANVTIAVGPLVDGLLAGLTPGAIYYLTNTPGAIATTPGTLVRAIGIAVTATALRLFGAPIVSSSSFRSGTGSRGGNTTSGNQVIAHGFGVTPNKLRVTGWYFASGGSEGPSSSFGVKHGSTTNCMYGTSATAVPSATDSTNVIHIEDFDTPGTQVATATLDATNITLAWTKTGTLTTENIVFLWEVE
jgi:hypothetical protein